MLLHYMSLVRVDDPLPAAPALLQQHMDRHALVKIIEQVMTSDIPSYANLRMDPSLIQHLLKIVRVKMPDGSEELHARIVLEVLGKAWGLTEQEAAAVDLQIRFIVANGLSVLKRPSVWKRVRRFFSFAAGK